MINLKSIDIITWIISVIVSGAVGALVGLPFILFFKDPNLPVSLLKSGLFGMAIGLIGAPTFGFFLKNVKNHIFRAMISVFAVIGLGTFASGFIMGVRDIPVLLMIISSAELAGLCYTIFSYRYYLKINKRLVQYKISLKRNQYKEKP